MTRQDAELKHLRLLVKELQAFSIEQQIEIGQLHIALARHHPHVKPLEWRCPVCGRGPSGQIAS